MKPIKPKKEKSIHNEVSDYINKYYPNTIFGSDASGIKATPGVHAQIVRQKSANFKNLDLHIFEPKMGYHALIIELKRTYDEVWRKDGKMRESEQIQEQWVSIQNLNSKGYFACFGYDKYYAIKVIDTYMNEEHKKLLNLIKYAKDYCQV